MKRWILSVALTTLVVLCAGTIRAAALWGNCEKMALAITPRAATLPYSVMLQREWNPDGYVYIESTGTIVQSGDWLDMDSSTTNGVGVYYFTINVQKGNNYLLWTDAGTDCMITMRKSSGFSLHDFDSVTAQDTGIVYHYLRAEDWTPSDSNTCAYVVKLITLNERNKYKNLYFTQQSVTDIVKNPGSKLTPIEMDLSQTKTVTVVRPSDGHPIFGSAMPVTYYTANLLAGVEYRLTLAASSPLPQDYYNFIDVIGDESVRFHYAETSWNAETRVYTLRISADADTMANFYVYAYEPDKTKLSWGLAEQINYAGAFKGRLIDLDDLDKGEIPAAFCICAVTDGVMTNYSGTVSIDGRDYAVSGSDGTVYGELTVGKKNFEWFFDVAVVDSTVMSIDGTAVALVDGEIEELFYQGFIAGGLMLKEDSFLQFDKKTAQGLSATAMGIAGGAFVGEQAHSPDLEKLWKWAGENNVSIAEASKMTFGGGGRTGSPDGLTEEAYLLDCIPSESQVAAAKAKFVIASFDPATGVVVAGVKDDGVSYGNGKVEVRSSRAPDGTYDTTAKADAAALFYRAYLVR